jgi:hypothetical protein
MRKSNQQNAMKFLILIAALPIALLGQGSSNIPSLQLKTVTFTVQDPEGNPVENAFVEASRRGPGNATGHTDSNGQLSLELTQGASLHVYVSKDGYYNTGGELWRGGMYKGPNRKLVARVVPDSFEIQMKPVKNPLPLHYGSFSGIAPKYKRPVGFDLKLGDWVSPFGKGRTTDILFHFHGIHVDESGHKGTMSILFPNPDDGIQPFMAARPFSREFGSDLAPPNEAPVDGYESRLSYTIDHKQGDHYEDYTVDGRNYLIRTRTERDAGGVLRKACYGWIEGEIEFDPRSRPGRGPQLKFTWYFNDDPNPDARSLEFDRHVPKKR